MIATRIPRRRLGFTFAAVHDLSWTNTVRVEVMNSVLREELIRLHEKDLPSELRERFLCATAMLSLRTYLAEAN